MKRDKRNQQGKSAFELLEEAVHLLRTRPLGSFASYYIGTLPFILGLLYFWTDMSRSPFANQHQLEAGLGLAVLFLWMKTWQAVFAGQLLEALTGNSVPLTWRRGLRILAAQTALQPSALFLVPLASIPLLPLPWAWAFYQNATVFGADEGGSTRALFKRAAQQARTWPKQNHVLLSVLSAFGLFVFLNWTTVVLLLPLAFKTLFGIESAFSRSPLSMLNTTFIAIVAGLTYLSVDPLNKAVYALRCFYGEALRSGADLKSELRQFATAGPMLALLILLLAPMGVLAQPGGPQPLPPAADSSGGVSPQELDRTISEVLRQQKYSWRSPREKLAQPEAAEKGVIGRFLERVVDKLKDWGKSVLEWIGRMLQKLFRQTPQISPPSSGFGWMTRLHLLIYLLVAAAVVAILLLVRRVVQNRRARGQMPVVAEALRPQVDLADENVAPDQLPEDGWTQLAHELLARGEFRLALRAFYLASLAQLAGRNLVSIARFKSNRDYERELLRRGHAWPALLRLFSDNVTTFDRVWYGMHPVDGGLVNSFAANVEEMRGQV